jgi:hypothetical protein
VGEGERRPARGGANALSRMRGAEMLAHLVPSVIRFVIDEPRVHLREMDLLATLAERVPIHRLSRPRDLAHLPEAVRAVRALLSGPSP